jgi:hypothetical protein
VFIERYFYKYYAVLGVNMADMILLGSRRLPRIFEKAKLLENGLYLSRVVVLTPHTKVPSRYFYGGKDQDLSPLGVDDEVAKLIAVKLNGSDYFSGDKSGFSDDLKWLSRRIDLGDVKPIGIVTKFDAGYKIMDKYNSKLEECISESN